MRRRPFLGMRSRCGGSRRPPRGYRCPGSRRAARPPPRARIRRSRRKADSARARPHPPWRRAAPWSSHTPPHRARRGCRPWRWSRSPGRALRAGPARRASVVLGERGDVLEEGATHLVVEPHRRDRLGRRGEPAADVGLEGGPEVLGPEMHVDAQVLVAHRPHRPSCEATRGADAPSRSAARRRPLKAQRLRAEKKLRYVARTWPRGVAQLPPRSTYWLTMTCRCTRRPHRAPPGSPGTANTRSGSTPTPRRRARVWPGGGATRWYRAGRRRPAGSQRRLPTPPRWAGREPCQWAKASAS